MKSVGHNANDKNQQVNKKHLMNKARQLMKLFLI